jgi:hypothetical protein
VLQALNGDSYVFLDANIDLLKLNVNNLSNDYMDVNLSNGFVQLICRATRIQGQHFSLIDHILANSNHTSYTTGTLISDLSDHFINFIQIPTSKPKPKTKTEFKRQLTADNIIRFKNALSNLSWDEVCTGDDVDGSFDKFWTIFHDLYNLHFPKKVVKFNKNYHKINNYMTTGLLVSRSKKLELCKISSKERTGTPQSFENYKKYGNTYNSLLRLSKKMYFDKNFEIVKKKQKNMGIFKRSYQLKQIY